MKSKITSLEFANQLKVIADKISELPEILVNLHGEDQPYFATDIYGNISVEVSDGNNFYKIYSDIDTLAGKYVKTHGCG